MLFPAVRPVEDFKVEPPLPVAGIGPFPVPPADQHVGPVDLVLVEEFGDPFRQLPAPDFRFPAAQVAGQLRVTFRRALERPVDPERQHLRRKFLQLLGHRAAGAADQHPGDEIVQKRGVQIGRHRRVFRQKQLEPAGDPQRLHHHRLRTERIRRRFQVDPPREFGRQRLKLIAGVEVEMRLLQRE